MICKIRTSVINGVFLAQFYDRFVQIQIRSIESSLSFIVHSSAEALRRGIGVALHLVNVLFVTVGILQAGRLDGCQCEHGAARGGPRPSALPRGDGGAAAGGERGAQGGARVEQRTEVGPGGGVERRRGQVIQVLFINEQKVFTALATGTLVLRNRTRKCGQIMSKRN